MTEEDREDYAGYVFVGLGYVLWPFFRMLMYPFYLVGRWRDRKKRREIDR